MNSARASRPIVCALLGLVMASLATPAAAQQEGESGKAERAERAQAAFDRGMEYYVEEDYAKAIVEFKRAKSLYPSALLWYNIAMARMYQGKETKAQEAAEEALQFDGEPLPQENRAKVRALIVGSRHVASARRQANARKEAMASGTAPAGASEPSDERAGLGAIGWTGVAVGGLGVSGLVGVPFMAAKYDREIQRLREVSTGPSRQRFRDQKSRVETTRETGRLLLYGASALTVVGGGLIALDLWGMNRTGQSEQRVSARIGVRGRLRIDVRW